LIPTRLYLEASNTPQTSTGTITVYYNKESLDIGSYESTKKYYVNGFVRDYDSSK
jgi:hypothetical protein